MYFCKNSLNYIKVLVQTNSTIKTYEVNLIMLSTVRCSEHECVYQNDGYCMLDTAKPSVCPINSDIRCVYYCTRDMLNQKLSAQKV